MLVSGNTRPIIGDRDDRSAITRHNLDDHLTTVAAMFDGIINYIGNCIEQKISVTCDEYSLITDKVEMVASFLGGGIEQLHHLTRDLG